MQKWNNISLGRMIMPENAPAKWRIAFAGLVAIFIAGCQAPSSHRSAEVWRGSDFERGMTDGWSGIGGATVAVTRAHASHGRQALAVSLLAGKYPGIICDFSKPQDWSDCVALRFHVFNAEQHAVTVSIRVDDTGSRNFATRYNDDIYAHRLAPGENEVGITLLALRQGSFLARGLDVDHISAVRIFASLQTPAKLIFDDFRLVRSECNGPSYRPLMDLSGKDSVVRWSTANGATARQVLATINGPDALEVKMSGDAFPRLGIVPSVTNWLGYDLLRMNFNCEAETRPTSLEVKVTDVTGRRQTVNLHDLDQPGLNEITIPLDIFGEVALGRVAEVALFAAPSKPQALRVTSFGLQRVVTVPFPAIRDAAVTNAALTLDLADFRVHGKDGSALMGRNTAFLLLVHVPLRSGETRVIRCNSAGLSTLQYALPESALQDYRPDGGIHVWIYVSDHGVWECWHRVVGYAGIPATVPLKYENQ